MPGKMFATLVAVSVLLSAPAAAQVLYGSQGGGGVGSGGSLVVLDTTDASAALVGVPFGGVGLPGIAFLPDGRLFAVSSVNHGEALDTAYLLEINPDTGALISSQPLLDGDGNGCAFGDLAVQPGTGILFAMAANQSSLGSGGRCGLGGGFGTGGYLATIDPDTGIYTMIGRDPDLGGGGNASGGIAFGSDGTLYFTTAWLNDNTLRTLDPSTGTALTSIALDGDSNFFGLAWHAGEGRLYGSFNCCNQSLGRVLAVIDPVAGTVNPVGVTDVAYNGLAFRGDPEPTITPLPVPVGSLGWLLILAVLMLLAAASGLVRRRRVAD